MLYMIVSYLPIFPIVDVQYSEIIATTNQADRGMEIGSPIYVTCARLQARLQGFPRRWGSNR